MSDDIKARLRDRRAGARGFALVLLGISVFISLTVLFVFLAIWLPMKSYISEAPFPIDHIPPSDSAETAVTRKVIGFYQDPHNDSLILSSEEVNHLLRQSQLVEKYGVAYRVTLEDGLINIRCSVPAQKVKNQFASIIRYLKIEGYINAEVEGKLMLKEGKMVFVSTNAQMNGREAPFGVLGKRTHLDISEFIADKTAFHKWTESLQSCRIEGGRLVLEGVRG